MNRIEIPLDNGYKLIAEQNIDSEFDKEMFIGIESDTGAYLQDLAIVRPTYKHKDGKIKFASKEFEMLIFGDKERQDFTDKFTVELYEEPQE